MQTANSYWFNVYSTQPVALSDLDVFLSSNLTLPWKGWLNLPKWGKSQILVSCSKAGQTDLGMVLAAFSVFRKVSCVAVLIFSLRAGYHKAYFIKLLYLYQRKLLELSKPWMQISVHMASCCMQGINQGCHTSGYKTFNIFKRFEAGLFITCIKENKPF